MKTKLASSFFLFSFFFLLSSFSSLAAPTIISERDQTFDQNDPPTQLRTITITEDASETSIKQGTIKITIPSLLPIIFDDERTLEGIAAYGTAVDNGKVSGTPAVTFTDQDKTIIIPINADFAVNEQLNLTKIFVEGFHEQPSNSDKLTLKINEVTEISDTRNLYVRTSSTNDTRAPEIPSNIQIVDDENGLKISWTDPTDLDLQLIQILRGKNDAPISGTPYAEVVDGVEEYIDTDVKEGDTLKYILRATDGKNTSPNSTEISFVVSSNPAEENPTTPVVEEPAPAPIPDGQIMCTELYAPVCGIDNKTYSNACKASLEKVDVAYQGGCQAAKPVPSDIDNHWSEQYTLGLFSRGVIKGYSDGTFRPDNNLNRAEAAALIYRTIYNAPLAPQSPLEKPFLDVPTDAWYAGYIFALKELKLINGNPDGTYQPTELINRAEFLTLALNAYYHWTTDEGRAQVDNLKTGQETKTYVDVDDEWYAATVSVTTQLGFVSGESCTSGICFNASNPITRAESAKILFEMFFK